MKQNILILLMIAFAINAHAFNVDGIYYNQLTNKTNEVEVTRYGGNNYSGKLEIPSTIKYSDAQYTVTAVSSYAFYNCWKLNTIIFPATINYIGDYAFLKCAAYDVYVYSTTPPDVSTNAFIGMTSNNHTLYVPKGCTSLYKATAWNKFIIKEFDASTGIEECIMNDVKKVSEYTIDGQKVNNTTKGIKIVKMNNGTIKKVLVK
jgi:hypothetical protein